MTPCEPMEMLQQCGLRPPRTLTIAITGACNLACRHCWVGAGVLSAPGHVSARKLRRVIEEFAALDGEGVRFTGGEPLCHPEWLELMRFTRGIGFRTLSLQTNGMLLKDEHMPALGELDFPGLSIQVSLDGASARTHDLVRGEGAFSGALHGIKMLVQQGLAPRVSVFFTEMRHNLGEIPELLDFADSIGISSVVTGSLVQCGRASETTLVAPPEVAQYLDLLERYDSDSHFRELYEKIGTVAALEWRANDAAHQGCCTFIENPYLTPAGRIYPCLLCHADEFSVTGVYEKGLAAAIVEGVPLWSALLRISRRRSDEIPECRDCPGRLSCAGGCMGRAWGSCGNLLAVDDRCGVRRAIYNQTCKS